MLFRHYMRNFSQVKDFYGSHYSSTKFKKIEPLIPRHTVCDELFLYNRRIGASEKTLHNIELLRNEDSFAVVSGQQPGLFCGPLYTIYKALSAIMVAERFHFIPIFWNASEDSDFDEVNHTSFFSGDTIRSLSTSIEGGGRSISDIPSPKEEIRELLSSFISQAPQTEFGGELAEAVQHASDESATLSEFFSRIMTWLFGDFGLVIVEPYLLRKFSLPIVEKALAHPIRVSEILGDTGERLHSLGYEPQLVKKSDSTNLYVVDGKRHPLLYYDSAFHAGEKTFQENELFDMLHHNPHSISTGVALRPIVQDYVLPTAAYIAGPAEIAYFAQLLPVYKYLGVEQSLLYPRYSVTIVESKIKKIIDKYALDFLQLAEPQEIVNKHARESVEETFTRYYSEMDMMFEGMRKDIPPSLEKSLEATRAATRNNLSALQKKVQSEKKREDELFASQVRKASSTLFPTGEMQERVVGFMEYYNKYGRGFVQDIYDALKSASPDNHILLYR
jgi:bacillithiol biosynthesis cysteine-adding enzyme BshC